MIKLRWQESLDVPQYISVTTSSNTNTTKYSTNKQSHSIRQNTTSISTSRHQAYYYNMDTIREDSTSSPTHFAATHPGINSNKSISKTWRSSTSSQRYTMNEKGEVLNIKTHEKLTREEIREHGEVMLKDLIEYVHSKMLSTFNFLEQAIPALEEEEDILTSPFSYASSASTNYGFRSSISSISSSICSTADGFRTMVDSNIPRCIFHTSMDYGTADKLLVFVCSNRGLSCGIWSRTSLLQEGVQVGSMLPYFQAAIAAGYGILVMNPNMNTQTMVDSSGQHVKLPITGSSTQEEHVDYVWKNYIFPSAAHKIHFIAYGYGGTLVTNLLETYRHELKHRLGNVAYIESSHKADNMRWSDDFQKFFSQHALCWKTSALPINTELSPAEQASNFNTTYHKHKNHDSNSPKSNRDSTGSTGSSHSTHDKSSQYSVYGCLCLSAGPGTTENDGKTETRTGPAGITAAVRASVFEFLESPSAYEYQRIVERQLQKQAMIAAQQFQVSRNRRQGDGLHNIIVRSKGETTQQQIIAPKKMTIDDFQLLRVVGRGAFGKVMLVRPRNHIVPQLSRGTGSTQVYAMKVIKKSAVFAKNQIEHTKTERRILQEVDHPFMVKLRYAFQNETKLYFVMDYYNGGTLQFHLRTSKFFEENRAQFYAAQLVLALSHLHSYQIVYRDLKPENCLMDSKGFIAITDFGLSHDNVEMKNPALRTFCGTPEYIAPELIRRIPYGRAADYWSLGILIFEMLAGYTPFYHPNRKRNFENIVRVRVRFPSYFSEEAKSLCLGLLTKDPTKRLGSGPCGVKEIMEHAFFESIDWEKLYRREVHVPFVPNVSKQADTSNIPEYFRRQEVIDSICEVPEGTPKDTFDNFTYSDPLQM